MPATMTEMQRRFAIEYATNGGKATEAAIAAGYSAKSACDLGRKALENHTVQYLITKELARLRARSGAIGWKAMVEIAQNERAAANARVSAAKALMEHAGMIGAAQDKTAVRDPHGADGPATDYKSVLDAIAQLNQPVQTDTLQ